MNNQIQIQTEKNRMTEQEKQAVVEQMKKYQVQKGISQNLMAEQCGVSAANLSNMRNGNWELIKDALWNKVAAYLDRFMPEERGRVGWSWKLKQTDTSATVMNTCAEAQAYSKMMFIIGPAGAGKSTAARRYTGLNANVFYVQCLDGDTRIGFLNSVLRELGVSNFRGSAGDKVRKIAEQLNQMQNPLLIIDEAGVLRGKKVNAIKDIWNETEGRLGIVLVGVNYIYSAFSKAAENEEEGMPEFMSRKDYVSTVKKIGAEQFRTLCSENGLEGDKESYNWLYAYTKGDLRRLSKTAEIIMAKLGGTISTEALTKLFR